MSRCAHNKLSQHDLRSGACFCVGRYAYTKSIACTPAAAAGRYERGSKINKTSHVLYLRHVVAGLSALKYVGSLYLTSFVPGAK